jgi:hypothetical protein
MAWLDDRIWCTQKLLALSDRAHRLWVNSIAFSSGMGTRGVLTVEQQQLVRTTRATRTELVASGLWDEAEAGAVRIHDWDDHNLKRDERREKDRERKRALRRAERPQDSPQERPQERRTLKEVKEVKVEEPNGSSEKVRERNPIWDALVEVFGEPSTDTARTLRGKVCSSLTRAGATPEEVVRRAKSWPRHFDTATLTETALEKHWDALGRAPMRVGR